MTSDPTVVFSTRLARYPPTGIEKTGWLSLTSVTFTTTATCVYGCMGVWVYGCMYGCVYGCMGVWVYGCMCVWVYVWVYDVFELISSGGI